MRDILMTNDGWVGFFGMGGSIFEWNPEEQISFGYVPFDYIIADGISTSGESIKNIVTQCVKKTYKEQPEVVNGGCATCNVF